MGSIQSKTYYELLGVPPEASKEEIKAAYKEIARIFHPDSHFYDDILTSAGMGGGTVTNSKVHTDDETFKQITAAYNILTNDTERARYDAILPRGLEDWEDEELTANFSPNSKVFQPDSRLSAGGQAAQRSNYAYGLFGRVAEDNDVESAFDSPELQPVSAMLRQPRFWLLGKVRKIIGL